MSLKLNSSGGGSVTLQEPVTASTLTLTLPATSGTMVLDGGSPTFATVTSTALTVNGNNISAVNSMGFRNRIINGDMGIDQRNAGAAVTHSGTSNLYVLDRWACNSTGTPQFSVQQVADAPTGFVNSSKLTTTTAGTPAAGDFSYYLQYIEGLNVADLNFGTASALTVTLSFWVKSSLTGTFGGTLKNGAVNRAYPFSYTINSAGTWEYKTVTIPGDTTGTWLTTNGIGMTVAFDTGSGANNKGTAGAWNATSNIGVTGGVNLVATAAATWQITGVQLEAGTVATPFERIDYGRELMMCQRYYEKSYPIATVPGASSIIAGMSWLVNGYSSTIYVLCTTTFKATKRTSATIAYWDAAGNSLRTTSLTGGGLSQVDNNNNIYATTSSESGFFIYVLAAPSLNCGVQWTASAEL